MKKFVVTTFLIALLISSVCLAADAGVVNHVMANKIECAPEKGCAVIGSTNVQIEIPKGQPGAKHTFSTLDQLILIPVSSRSSRKLWKTPPGWLSQRSNPTASR